MLEQVNEVDLAIGVAPNEEEEDEDKNSASAKAAAEDFSHKLEGQNAKFEEEMRVAVQAQEQLKHELMAKQAEERLRLEVEMKRDAEAFEAKILAEQDRKMRQLEEQRVKLEQETQASSEDTRKLLLDMHETKMNQMEKVRGGVSGGWRLAGSIWDLCASASAAWRAFCAVFCLCGANRKLRAGGKKPQGSRRGDSTEEA